MFIYDIYRLEKTITPALYPPIPHPSHPPPHTQSNPHTNPYLFPTPHLTLTSPPSVQSPHPYRPEPFTPASPPQSNSHTHPNTRTHPFTQPSTTTKIHVYIYSSTNKNATLFRNCITKYVQAPVKHICK